WIASHCKANPRDAELLLSTRIVLSKEYNRHTLNIFHACVMQGSYSSFKILLRLCRENNDIRKLLLKKGHKDVFITLAEKDLNRKGSYALQGIKRTLRQYDEKTCMVVEPPLPPLPTHDETTA
ncbi:MAG: hypothetical protein O3A01_08920, partial [bacterium]|nr:hypothetical protein [bacterium]